MKNYAQKRASYKRYHPDIPIEVIRLMFPSDEEELANFTNSIMNIGDVFDVELERYQRAVRTLENIGDVFDDEVEHLQNIVRQQQRAIRQQEQQAIHQQQRAIRQQQRLIRQQQREILRQERRILNVGNLFNYEIERALYRARQARRERAAQIDFIEGLPRDVNLYNNQFINYFRDIHEPINNIEYPEFINLNHLDAAMYHYYQGENEQAFNDIVEIYRLNEQYFRNFNDPIPEEYFGRIFRYLEDNGERIVTRQFVLNNEYTYTQYLIVMTLVNGIYNEVSRFISGDYLPNVELYAVPEFNRGSIHVFRDIRIIEDNTNEYRVANGYFPYIFNDKSLNERFNTTISNGLCYFTSIFPEASYDEIIDILISLNINYKDINKISNKISERIIEKYCEIHECQVHVKITDMQGDKFHESHHTVVYGKNVDSVNPNVITRKVIHFENHYFPFHEDLIKPLENKEYTPKKNRKDINTLFDKYIEELSTRYNNYDNFIVNNDFIVDQKLKKEPDETLIIYYDIETRKLDNTILPFMLCYAVYEEKNNVITEKTTNQMYLGYDCMQKFAKFIARIAHNNIYVYAHNGAKFDNIFLRAALAEVYSDASINVIECNQNDITTVINIKRKTIYLKDSYTMLSMKLSEFSKSFGLDSHKEYMDYSILDVDKTVKDGYSDLNKWTRHEKICEHAKEQSLPNTIYRNGKVNLLAYIIFYCKCDVKVLSEGFNKFIEICKEAKLKNPLHFNTISGYSSSHIKVTDKTWKPSNIFEYHYRKNGIIGGRVCTKDNKAHKFENKHLKELLSKVGSPVDDHIEKLIASDYLVDMDAVSLYPSAMYLFDMPQGIPKICTDEEFRDLSYISHGYVNIHSIPKHSLPVLSTIEKGIRIWDDKPGLYLLSNRYLDAAGITDYSVVKAWKFPERAKIFDIVKTFFDLRKEAKAKKLPSQIVYKLMLNSAYGRLIMNKSEKHKKFVRNEQFKNYYNNHYIVEDPEIIGNYALFKEIETDISVNELPIHIGYEILLCSKMLMMNLSNNPDNLIYYTDTDSVHMKPIDGFIEGKDLGNFHNDINIDGKPIIHTAVISAAYFISKKFYNHIIFYKDNDNKLQVTAHNVIKGISNNATIESGERLCEFSVEKSLEVFEKIYNGESITFDLLGGGNVSMIKGSTGITLRQELKRKVGIAK